MGLVVKIVLELYPMHSCGGNFKYRYESGMP